MKYKIKFDKKKCRGCGACTVCENWKLGSDGEVAPIKSEFDDIGCNQDAVDVCPIGIIEIVEQ